MLLQDLIGSDTWACVARKCLFNDIVDATLAHLRETQFINVRVSRYYSLRQYWTDFATSRGMPDDPKILRLFWSTVGYGLLLEKETLLRDYIRVTFLSLPPLTHSGLGMPAGEPAFVSTPKPRATPRIVQEVQDDLGDIPRF